MTFLFFEQIWTQKSSLRSQVYLSFSSLQKAGATKNLEQSTFNQTQSSSVCNWPMEIDKLHRSMVENLQEYRNFLSGGLVYKWRSWRKGPILEKDSLDSIPSPSVKIQIIGWESLLEVIRQKIAGWCQQTSFFQKFVDNTLQCFAFTSQANFPTHNLNFHWRWRWWARIQATL